MRTHDWSATPFGRPELWPQSLKTAVSICLNSRFPIPLWWGPELRLIYNDAWRPVLGQSKHPGALGAPGEEVWPEIWHIIGPMLRGVLETGTATWSDDGLLMLDRNGYLEEAYFTYSYSPIRDESGNVGGVFSAVNETTERVIGERQIALLRELGARTAEVRSFVDACEMSAQALSTNAFDLPFVLLYLRDAETGEFVLTASSGIDSNHPAADPIANDRIWPLATSDGLSVIDLPDVGQPWPTGPWSRAPACAAVLPLAPSGADGRTGALVAALNPHRLVDAGYRRFLELIRGQISAAVGNAQAYEEERQRAEALAELDRAKSTFFSNVSHEFRTPLTLMLGPLSDVLANEATPPAIREQLSMVERNGLRLSKLVNALLEFSRLEAGRVQTSLQPTDLSRLTSDLASSFRSAIERAGLVFEVDCAPLGTALLVDREMWEKIVLNLLSNALKFTLEGRISVRLYAEAGQAVLEVADTGVGVPADEVPRLFERFHRVEGTRGRTHEGTGIGLALVQELVHLHGGTIEARSALDVGTTFVARIPMRPAAASASRQTTAPAGRGTDTFVQEAMRWLPATNSKDADAAEQHTVLGPAGRYRTGYGARIVVADDNADMREYVSGLLSPYYRVEAVSDGLAALEAIRRERPALLLSDVMMPGLDGFELLRLVRDDDHLRTLPVVLLSARAGEEARLEGLDQGADDYLVKPFSARELVAKVGALLELNRLRRVNEDQLRLALSGARMFTWSIDLVSGAVTTSGNAAELLGIVPGNLETSFAQLHGDDVGPFREKFEAAITSRSRLDMHVRHVRMDNGEVVWLDVRGQVVTDEEDRPVQMSGVCFDISESKRLEEALREADRRKDEFLAMLAHELRNPLAPIGTSAQILKRSQADATRVVHAADVIERQVTHLTSLVDDLLDVSRVTRGLVAIDHVPLDLRAVIAAATEQVQPLLHERRHELRTAVGPGRLVVRGDFNRLVQVVTNLLTNAAKYTPQGGNISLQLGVEDGQALIRVSDNGIGIKPDLLPAIFELFTQAERSPDRNQGGLGIGLALVRSLVGLHGGTVEACSAGVNEGSAFTVRLPLEPLAPAVARAEVPAQPDAAGKRRILVVDDNRDALETLAELLRMLGHQVTTAPDGETALAVAASDEWDTYVLDIGLPDMTGFQLAERLRRAQPSSKAVYIALTGYGQAQDRVLSKAAGFDHHLVKPPNVEELIAILQLSSI